MTLHWTDLILILALVAAGSAVGYMLMLRKLRQIVTERELKIADQLAALDDAIRALETRLVEHHAISVVNDAQLRAAAENDQEEIQDARENRVCRPGDSSGDRSSRGCNTRSGCANSIDQAGIESLVAAGPRAGAGIAQPSRTRVS